jgi:signal transduction histidine kinase
VLKVPGKESGQLYDRIMATAEDVVDFLGYAVEVVCVGDTAMTEAHEALVQASREAMLNASRHGGGTVSVYLEVSDGRADVFIKDRGPGFDLNEVPEDRMGVRESIIGRMKRHGGTAAITSTPDGTEVRLGLPARHLENSEGKA